MPKGRRCRGSPVAGAGTRRHEAWEAQVCIKKSGAGCHVVGGMGGLGDPGISISASECQPHACSLTLWEQPPPKDAYCLRLQVPEVLPGSREVRPNPRTFIRPGTRNPPVECQLPTTGHLLPAAMSPTSPRGWSHHTQTQGTGLGFLSPVHHTAGPTEGLSWGIPRAKTELLD